MQKGIEYYDVAREVIAVLAKYEMTVRDFQVLMDGIYSEMLIQPAVPDSGDSAD